MIRSEFKKALQVTVPETLSEGTIVSVLPNQRGLVSLARGPMLRNVVIPEGAQALDKVLLFRPRGGEQWRVVLVNSQRTIDIAADTAANVFSPTPEYLTTTVVFDKIAISWQGYPSFEGVYEVQGSFSGDHSDALSFAITQGSFALLNPGNNEVAYVRVRAINKNFSTSSWTSWHEVPGGWTTQAVNGGTGLDEQVAVWGDQGTLYGDGRLVWSRTTPTHSRLVISTASEASTNEVAVVDNLTSNNLDVSWYRIEQSFKVDEAATLTRAQVLLTTEKPLALTTELYISDVLQYSGTASHNSELLEILFGSGVEAQASDTCKLAIACASVSMIDATGTKWNSYQDGMLLTPALASDADLAFRVYKQGEGYPDFVAIDDCVSFSDRWKMCLDGADLVVYNYDTEIYRYGSGGGSSMLPATAENQMLIADSLNDWALLDGPTAEKQVLISGAASPFTQDWRELTEGDIPASIARDSEVTTAISDHAAIDDAHHDPVTLAAGSDALLTLSGQELDLADVPSQAEFDTHASRHESGGADTVNHDSLVGFVADEHIDHTTVTLTAGNGLTGGGTIAANRQFDLDNDIAKKLFTDATGLLLLGPGCRQYPGGWVSQRNQKATITGGFRQMPGRWAKTVAPLIERTTTNRITDPVFGYGDFTQWTTVGTPTKTIETTGAIRFCDAAAKFVVSSTQGGVVKAYTTSTGGDWTASAYFYIESYTSGTLRTMLRIRYTDSTFDDFATNAVITKIDEWQRLVASGTADTGKTVSEVDAYFYLTTGVATFRLDGAQLENLGYATSLCWGNAGKNYSWLSGEHASASTRSTTLMSFTDPGINLATGTSLSFWFQMPYDAGTTGLSTTRGLFTWWNSWNTESFYIAFSASFDTISVTSFTGSASQLSGVSASLSGSKAGDWHHVVVTARTDEVKIYLDGELSATDKTFTAPSITSTTVYLGYTTERFGGVISEFAAIDDTLTAEEISNIYILGAPLVDTGAFVNPVDNLGPNNASWMVMYGGSATSATSYGTANSYEFGWGGPVSGKLQLTAVLSVTSALATGYAILQWDNSGTWTDIPGSEVSHTPGSTTQLVYSSVFDLPPTSRTYRLSAKISNASYSVTVEKADLICTPNGIS